jgi:lipid-A-disaccharide synthase-like uncharacterized protein
MDEVVSHGLQGVVQWAAKELREPWTAVGLVGQVIFSLRFIMQWIASERAGRSVVPDVFWYLSIAGSLVLFIYSLHLKDLVFMLGQSAGFLVYARNLVLRKRETGA